MALPLEIIEIVLSKLSVKPLLRFKSVCKSWNTMISDPVFVQNHIRRSKYSNSDNLFLCYDTSSSNRFRVTKLEDRKFLTLQVIEGPYGRGLELCFCEGVILLTDPTFRRFALWNPSTRTHKELSHPKKCYEASFGICRDAITDDFKVVIVSWGYYSVYCCKNESWMILEKEFEIEYTELCLRDRAGVCVDGASYWIWNRDDVKQIIYYDPRDDKFKIVHKPENVDGSKSIHLVDLRGSLCMCSKGRNETRVQIWTKEKGIDNHSWKELMTVEDVNMHLLSFQPLCFVGNKIVIRINHGKLVFYSPSEKRLEEFEEDAHVFDFMLLPIPYVESMFFFPIEKPSPEKKRKRKCPQQGIN